MRSMIGSVEPPPPDCAGPPRSVINKGWAKRLNDAMIVIMMIKTKTERNPGIVTKRNRCHAVAPSMEAASYSDDGIFCKAASRITILNPLVHQTVTSKIAYHAQGIDDSQRGCPTPIAFR